MSTLRELAEAATPGPWEWEGASRLATTSDLPRYQPHGGGIWSTIIQVSEEWFDHQPSEADAAYIAAVDPQTVLALLDRIEKLELAVRYGLDP